MVAGVSGRSPQREYFKDRAMARCHCSRPVAHAASRHTRKVHAVARCDFRVGASLAHREDGRRPKLDPARDNHPVVVPDKRADDDERVAEHEIEGRERRHIQVGINVDVRCRARAPLMHDAVVQLVIPPLDPLYVMAVVALGVPAGREVAVHGLARTNQRATRFGLSGWGSPMRRRARIGGPEGSLPSHLQLIRRSAARQALERVKAPHGHPSWRRTAVKEARPHVAHRPARVHTKLVYVAAADSWIMKLKKIQPPVRPGTLGPNDIHAACRLHVVRVFVARRLHVCSGLRVVVALHAARLWLVSR
mmetsp:Transcript_375/g.585  ORF Transcript_375/g.585 Transcript_375/m.585 type:complete len:306 (-) Transcript_375:122-1039(-)